MSPNGNHPTTPMGSGSIGSHSVGFSLTHHRRIADSCYMQTWAKIWRPPHPAQSSARSPGPDGAVRQSSRRQQGWRRLQQMALGSYPAAVTMISRQVSGVVRGWHSEPGVLLCPLQKKYQKKGCEILENTHLIAEINRAGQCDGVVKLLGWMQQEKEEGGRGKEEGKRPELWGLWSCPDVIRCCCFS